MSTGIAINRPTLFLVKHYPNNVKLYTFPLPSTSCFVVFVIIPIIKIMENKKIRYTPLRNRQTFSLKN